MGSTAAEGGYSSLKRQIVAIANKVRAGLTGRFDEVQQIVDNHDLVFAIWQDPSEPDGVGMMLIKGQGVLREIIAAGTSAETSMTGIPCTCIEQAAALKQVAGEPDRRH